MAQEISFNFIAVDKFSNIAKNVGNEANKAANKINNMSEKLIQTGKKMDQVGKKLTRRVSLPVAAIGTAAVVTAATFEKQMNAVGAVTESTGADFEALKEKAKELGSTTAFTASEAAQAQFELGKTGFKTKEILDGLGATLDIAAAAQLDLGTTAKISSDVLKSFGFEANQLADVGDVLVKAFVSANVDIPILGQAFKKLGPVASKVGADFEEMVAVVGTLGDVGIAGSTAGTSMNRVFNNLLNPTKKMKSAMEELGIDAIDPVTGEMISMADILDQINGAMGDFTLQLEDADGEMLDFDDIVNQMGNSTKEMGLILEAFGSRGGVSMAVLAQQGGSSLREFTEKLKNAGGTAEAIAGRQLEGLAGQVTKLKSALEGLFLKIIGQDTLDGLTEFVLKLTEIIQEFSESNEGMFKFIRGLALTLIVLGPVVSVLGKMIIAFAILKKLGIGAIFRRMSFVLLRVLGPIALLVGGLFLIIQNFGKIQNAMKRLNDRINESKFGQSRIGKFLNKPITVARGKNTEQVRNSLMGINMPQGGSGEAEVNINITDPGNNVGFVESSSKGVGMKVGKNMVPVGF